MQAYKERVGDLKLRTSFGILGNQSIGTYDRFTVYELYNNSYAYNNQTVSGAGFKLGKDNLTWEKTKTFNVGVDASFFNNALNVTFDYFLQAYERHFNEAPCAFGIRYGYGDGQHW